jgi:hypothetical protein
METGIVLGYSVGLCRWMDGWVSGIVRYTATGSHRNSGSHVTELHTWDWWLYLLWSLFRRAPKQNKTRNKSVHMSFGQLTGSNAYFRCLLTHGCCEPFDRLPARSTGTVPFACSADAYTHLSNRHIACLSPVGRSHNAGLTHSNIHRTTGTVCSIWENLMEVWKKLVWIGQVRQCQHQNIS